MKVSILLYIISIFLTFQCSSNSSKDSSIQDESIPIQLIEKENFEEAKPNKKK